MRISSSNSSRGVNINIDNIVIVLFSVLANVRAEIIKPWGEWMCNYCAMGNKICSNIFLAVFGTLWLSLVILLIIYLLVLVLRIPNYTSL